MGDDRFCYWHFEDKLACHLLDEEDEKLGWDLPDDDIDVPAHLMPAFQDEEDDSVLPSASHPSYPFGNPYASKPAFSISTAAVTRHGSSVGPFESSTTAGSNLPLPSLFHKPTTTNPASLATTLPNLELRQLFSQTTFGEPRERRWFEIAPDQVVNGGFAGFFGGERDAGEWGAGAGGAQGGEAGQGVPGDAPAPAGQNAADARSDDGASDRA